MAAYPPNRLAELRQLKRLERSELGALVGVTERQVRRWEDGETPIPDNQKFALAEIFGVSVVWLMGWGDGDPVEENGNGDDEAKAA